MSTLNEIKDDNRKTSKRKTLFSRLLEVIADMLGIKINEDSLLAAARDAYKAIKKYLKKVIKRLFKELFSLKKKLLVQNKLKILMKIIVKIIIIIMIILMRT